MEKESKSTAKGVFFIRDKQGNLHAHQIDMDANKQFLRDQSSANYLPHGEILNDLRSVLGEEVVNQNMKVAHMNKLISKDANLGLDK